MATTSLPRTARPALALLAVVAIGGCAVGAPAATTPAPSAPPTTTLTPATPTSQSPVPSAQASRQPTPAPSDEVPASLPPFVCVPSTDVPPTTERAQLTDVRIAPHEGYDRVVFEFADGIPQATVEAVLPPLYADPSGVPINVAGTAFLRVTLVGGTGVAPDGSVTYAGPTTFAPGLPTVAQLVQGGDFEAISTWYLGLNGGACIRVIALQDPSRLVIDIEH